MTAVSERSLRFGILGVLVLAAVFVVFDFGGPIRPAVTLAAVLVAPGLAASLSITSMPVDLRIVVSTIASAAVLALSSIAATLVGSNGSELVFAVVCGVTILLVVLSSLWTHNGDSGTTRATILRGGPAGMTHLDDEQRTTNK